MAPVSLLLVSTTLATGGAQRFTSTMLHHLDRGRIRPALCLLREEFGYDLPSDVTAHCLDYRGLLQGPRTVTRLRRLVHELRPDLILSNTAASNLICGLALRRADHHPVWVARIGTSPAHLDNPLRAFLARRAYPSASRFVVNSRGLVAALAEFYPFTRGRIEQISSPTDFEALDLQATETPGDRRPEAGPLLIAVGRLYREKRYDLMLEVLARVRRRVPASLWICGEGPERRGIVTRAEALGVGAAVRLLGFRRNPFSLMRQADLFIMTSDHEGLPNSLIEAQGLGLPAVSTRCPYGPQEIIEDGRTGILTPVGSAGALAEAALALLGDPERLRRMGVAARESARRRFSAGPLMREWEELMVRLLRGGREES